MRLFLTLRPRRLIWSLAAILFLFALFLARGPGRRGLTGAEIGQRAQQELQRTASYRFELAVRTVIDGQEATVSQVEGEFVRPDLYHIKGRSYDYPLEMYQLGEKIYFKDPADGKWKEARGGPNLVAEAVNLGTSPLVDFLRVGAFELVGRERLEGRECYHLRTPLGEVANDYWRVFFSDFVLEAWVGRSTFKIERVRLLGSNRSVPGDKLEIELKLFDHDAPIVITPPSVDEGTSIEKH
ncbi:MAG: hypothetical protein PWQ41_1591 [Bacillota bacterium]|nr:hypothetical protein [Bacillota bacterium]MDK2855568.1 hypothetical protein [Bacillota bacterium]MDK2925817.1 hypothetical protein [Bacillota bacterium]